MSFILLGILNSQVGAAVSPFWLSFLGLSSNDRGQGIALDSDKNVYAVGASNNSGTNDFQLAKYDELGAIQWQQRLGDSNGQDAKRVAVDSTNNILVVGNSSTVGNDLQLAKYNSSGAIQWQRRLALMGSFNFTDVATDSSDNVYVTGTLNVGGNFGINFAKYNSSGVIQWQRRLAGGSATLSGRISADSSGNVYVSGRSNASGTNRAIIAKYDTSGTIQWQRQYFGSVGDTDGQDISVTSTGDVYLTGMARDSATNESFVAKYNTSGVLQWQRSIRQGSIVPESLHVDSLGDVYVINRQSSNFISFKYDSSGSLEWQRSLASSGNEQPQDIVSDGAGNYFMIGFTNAPGDNDFFITRLPSSGSLTGTYTLAAIDFTYAVNGGTSRTPTNTDAAGSLTSSTASQTDAATSLGGAATSLTSTTQAL